jgi:hypothetical protein
MFLNCSTCFGRHTAYHQELKNCNCSLWFYIYFWSPAAAMAQPSQRPAAKKYVKPEAAITVFELLMISGVSPETCWAIKKHWNNKFYYTVASCWFFLWETLICLGYFKLFAPIHHCERYTIDVNKKVMCTVYCQTLLVPLNPPNATFYIKFAKILF